MGPIRVWAGRMLWILSQMVVHGRLADFSHHIFIFKAIRSARGNPEHLILLLLLLLFACIDQPHRRIDSRFLANQHSARDARFWEWSRRRLLRCWYRDGPRWGWWGTKARGWSDGEGRGIFVRRWKPARPWGWRGPGVESGEDSGWWCCLSFGWCGARPKERSGEHVYKVMPWSWRRTSTGGRIIW